MRITAFIFLLLLEGAAFGQTPQEKIKLLKSSHPEFMGALVQLQSSYLRDKKWENVLGISYVYRNNLLKNDVPFRVGPFLMEAYSLIQYCRYDDARSVLAQGRFYAKNKGNPEDIRKLEKASELEKLSQLYKNTERTKELSNRFFDNELQWEISPGGEEIIQFLDQVIIKAESLCQ